MRALTRSFFLLALLSPFALIVLVWLALDDAPTVTGQPALSYEDIARARSILQDNDPRRLSKGARRTIELQAQDLNLAGNYLLQRFFQGRARFTLSPDRLDLAVSLRLLRLPFRNYLNIDGAIESPDGHPRVTALRLGRLDLPRPVAAWIVQQLLAKGVHASQLASTAGLIKDLRLSPERLSLTYQWSPALITQARDTLLTSSELEALRYYYDALADLQSKGVGRSGAIVDLLEPLFSMALARSTERNPVDENTALLTILGTWASGQDARKLIRDGTRRIQGFNLKIAGRKDFAQHFLTSAALVARGDSVLSDAVGLYKELSDTDRGSGFSFTDIAADRAGTRFGELATRSPEDARKLQHRLAAGVADADIMPAANDLPEHIRAEAFSQRFGHIGSPAYQAMMAEIERRIDACALYRQ